MKKFLIFFFLFILINPSEATMQQVVFGSAAKPASSGYYIKWNGNTVTTASSTESDNFTVAPCNFNVTNFTIFGNVAPGDGNTITLTLREQYASTSATATLDAADTSKSWSGTEAISAGNKLDVLIEYTNAPTTTTLWWSITLTLSDNTSIIIGGVNDTPSVISQEWNQIAGGSLWGSESIGIYTVISTPGTIKNLYVETPDDVGDPGDSYAFTLYKNGVAQSLTCTISDGSFSCSDTNSEHAFSVSAGDYIELSCEEDGTADGSTFGWGVEFDPTTNGESMIHGATTNNYSISADRYLDPHANVGEAWNASEAGKKDFTGENLSLIDFYVILQTAPGAGKTFNFDIGQDSGGSSYGFTVSFPNTTSGNTSGTLSISSGDDFWIRSDIDASISTSGDSAWGITQYFTPVSAGRTRRMF